MLSKPALRLAPLALALLIAGCVTPPATEVTRFHLGQPIPSDTIILGPGPGMDANSLEFRSQAAVVARALDAVGLHPAADGNSGYIGTLRVEQSSHAGLPPSSPFRIGIGAAAGGVGGSVSLPVGATRSGEVRSNFLGLQIRRRSDGSMVWEGRAVQDIAADSPASALNVALPALSKALFSDFPGPSGQTVKVKSDK
ncbi:MAG: DUF4136 domain-containing protein [Polymorphobacter sp.]